MIWLSLALTAWAGVAAYGIWAWRADRRGIRAHEQTVQARADDTLKRATSLMESLINLKTSPPPFPVSGDNFTTLPDNCVEFGKRPRTDTPDGVA